MKLDMSPSQNLLLQSEQCKLEWAAGERHVALRHFDTLLDVGSGVTVGGTPLNHHDLLITMADWLTETNLEFPNVVMSKYLEVLHFRSASFIRN